MTYEQVAYGVRAVAAKYGEHLLTNKSAVSHWVRRGVQPSGKVGAYLTEVLSRRLRRVLTPEDLGLPSTENADLGLSLGPDPVKTIARVGRADIERRHFLTSATYSVAAAALPLGVAGEYLSRAQAVRMGASAGAADVEAVRTMTRVFTAIDERHGGQHGRTAVVQYLTTDVAELCRATFATDEQHREMLSAAASLAYLAGWKAFDAGEMGLAQRYYLQAYALTDEAGNAAHQAFVLRILAHHGMDNERPEHVLGLADRALSRARAAKVDPATESRFVICRARALAVSGRKDEAVAEAIRAGDIAEGADPDGMAEWASIWGSATATVSSHTAKLLTTVGDFKAAEGFYTTAANRYSGTEHRRIRALSLASAGRMQCAQGHVEQACETWSTSLGLLDGVRSQRARDAVGKMRADLARFHRRGVRNATELDERARQWLAA